MISKEKPIIFNTAMVKAILNGIKSQTRRVVRINGYAITHPEERLELWDDGVVYFSLNSMSGPYKCRYQAGDILWVRETYCYRKDIHAISFDPEPMPNDILYKADYGCYGLGKDVVNWRPAIHMPRKAARIFLQVKNVRIERLQDITIDDAVAEGCFADFAPQDGHRFRSEAISLFRDLWDSLNAKRGFDFKSNPWVWVIEFAKL